MKLDNITIKINRHLFDRGTSKINRVLRNFVPRGSTPRLRWLQTVPQKHSMEQRKGKEQSRNTQTEFAFARQGIPFGQFVQTQLDFPHFRCSLPF
jgi:hypothetical protein